MMYLPLLTITLSNIIITIDLFHIIITIGTVAGAFLQEKCLYFFLENGKFRKNLQDYINKRF